MTKTIHQMRSCQGKKAPRKILAACTVLVPPGDEKTENSSSGINQQKRFSALCRK